MPGAGVQWHSSKRCLPVQPAIDTMFAHRYLLCSRWCHIEQCYRSSCTACTTKVLKAGTRGRDGSKQRKAMA